MKKIEKIVVINIFLALLFSQHYKLNAQEPYISYIKGVQCSELLKRRNKESARSYSRRLNKQGLKEYRKKKYKKAAQYFGCAIKHDKKYAVAHYNYACMLAIIHYPTYNPCDKEFMFELSDHLKKSIQLDPRRRMRMLKDSDLKGIRENLEYKYLAIDPAADLNTILLRNTWYGPKPGAYPASPQVNFSGNGQVSIRKFNFTESGEAGWYTLHGTYIVSGKKFIITYEENGKIIKNKYTFVMKVKQGVVVSLYLKGEGHYSLSLDDDPCSA